jgi:hypothetical protein
MEEDRASREEAEKKVKQAIEQRQAWPELQGKRDIQAMTLALSPEFKGDRVAAFIDATADMIIVRMATRSNSSWSTGSMPSISTTPRAMWKSLPGFSPAARMPPARHCCCPTRSAARRAT